MPGPIDALTDREKRTLRLLLDGHDAKSIARHLGLSVHTINERLRDARRKLSVSSSREAARLLRAHEADLPQSPGDIGIGDAPVSVLPDPPERSGPMRPTRGRAGWAIGGSVMISLIVVALSLAPVSPQAPPADPAAQETAASAAARTFLALVDGGHWEESWAATGASFRAVNTVAGWRAASEKVRVPLGRVVSRRWLGEIDTPSPPSGYTVVRYRTAFANRRAATETLSLDREGGEWKVVGVYIE